MNLFRTNDNCYEGYDKEVANSRECLTFSEYNGNEKMTLYFDGGSRPIYKNEKKEKDNQPDLQYWKKDDKVKIAIWKRKTKNGQDYYSTSISANEQAPKKDNFKNPPERPSQSDLVQDDEDIPF